MLRIEELYKKYLEDSISESDRKELFYLLKTNDDERLGQLADTFLKTEAPGDLDYLQGDTDRILLQIRSQIEKSADTEPRSFDMWRWVAAAAIVAFAFIGYQVYNTQTATVPPVVSAIEDIVPGGNKAILVLADGSQVVLDTEQQGIVMDDAIHYSNGRILDKSLDLKEGRELQLYVPKGGIYQVKLADGTQVWLNSDTRLKYPSSFSGNQRVVELDGEAFFIVQSIIDENNNRIPFIVKSKNQSIEVLGTEFNVSGYASQSSIKTTLLEGRINVQVEDKKVTLIPGQQSENKDGREILVKKVDPQQAIAWKDGKFSFDGKSFAETLTEIGRWYDLSIVYKGAVPDIELVGDAYRHSNIKLVLRLLDAAAVNYKLDIADRKLIIY
ncbi:FecR family protein [Sphingobacterium faecale]|uniref:FecR domain-containing protein n=1 Tax=Sphingobacterium faecale TaxID=2803775 RepID=A0ABS1QXM1_9SPHI|nr:FecR family protein [Sphingobacterium faecale]MBL1407176.1 FecR domain-containing protein [Sphingobacterium faecale]